MKAPKVKIIGIIMTYQCARLLEDTYRRIPKNVFHEIILIDDGSTDNISQIAQNLKIKFFRHKHLGYGGNIKFGLKKALMLGADYMVEIHGDGQYDPSVIPSALRKMKKGNYDLLLGSRFVHPKQALSDGMPISRFVSNILFSAIDRFLFRIPLSEFYNGFRIYSRNLLEKATFKNTSNTYFYSFQIIIQAKYHNLRIDEIPVRCNYHKIHTSEAFWKAALHSIETFQIFAEYLKAKLGYQTLLFHK